MSRSSFFTTSSHSRSTSRDQNNFLLPKHDALTDVNLHDLSPRASPSPPPSFYRELRSPTSESTRSERKIRFADSPFSTPTPQFSAPPPPIAGSVMVLKGGVGLAVDGTGSRRGSVSASGVVGRERRVRNTGARAVGLGGNNDTLLGLERRERAIQEELQELLDAQSAGLVQGFGGGGDDGSGSSTPTTRSLQRDRERNRDIKGTVPVRQPKKKVLGLRGARKGLLRDMGELVVVKGEEDGLLAEEIERREECIKKAKGWKTRIEEVRREIGEFVGMDMDTSQTISNSQQEPSRGGKSEEDREIAELQNEERAVDNEIRETEDRLLQMRARKNWLGERIKERVNLRESRLSSYRGALREVEGEVREFLKRPPVMVSVVMGSEQGFMTLPAQRRTLEMAEEWWSKEIDRLRERKLEVQREKEALEEGAKLWRECVGVVVEFEDELRVRMRSGEAQDEKGLMGQVEKMGVVVKKLEEMVGVAGERKWNLLVCAVGAELEAFKEGKDILRAALGAMGFDIEENGKGEDAEGEDDAIPERKSIDTDIDTIDTRSTDDNDLKELERDLARQEEEHNHNDILSSGQEEEEHDLDAYILEKARKLAMQAEDFLGNGNNGITNGNGIGIGRETTRTSLEREESDEEQHLKEFLVDHHAVVDRDMEGFGF